MTNKQEVARMKEERIRKNVREGYAKIAREGLCCSSTSCVDDSTKPDEMSKQVGYTEEEMKAIPEGANLGLGCGNPVALASLKEGETVVDLGSGGGVDCFLAARKVGKNGKIIGVDMTAAMIDKARENARKGNYKNVEFRLGEIENLPVADNTADVVISNCVINLVPNKKRAFEEALRVLKPGGRLMISDVVLLKEIPESLKEKAHPASCAKGAIMKDKYLQTIKELGFENVSVIEETHSSFEDLANDPNAQIIVADKKRGTQELKKIYELKGEAKEELRKIIDSVSSINVSATKPAKKRKESLT